MARLRRPINFEVPVSPASVPHITDSDVGRVGPRAALRISPLLHTGTRSRASARRAPRSRSPFPETNQSARRGAREEPPFLHTLHTGGGGGSRQEHEIGTTSGGMLPHSRAAGVGCRESGGAPQCKTTTGCLTCAVTYCIIGSTAWREGLRGGEQGGGGHSVGQVKADRHGPSLACRPSPQPTRPKHHAHLGHRAHEELGQRAALVLGQHHCSGVQRVGARANGLADGVVVGQEVHNLHLEWLGREGEGSGQRESRGGRSGRRGARTDRTMHCRGALLLRSPRRMPCMGCPWKPPWSRSGA